MRVVVRDGAGRFARSVPAAAPVRAGAPWTRPPRFRLRVFHRAWPWRASYADALRDAIESGNADSQSTFLIVPAAIQRDPPSDADRWKMMRLREDRAAGG